MQNKLTALIASVYLLALPPPLYADPWDKNEFKAMVYVSFPLGELSAKEKAPTLGLTVRHNPTGFYRGLGSDIPSFEPPLFDKTGSWVDMRFNLRDNHLNTFRIGGMNALAIPSRLNADGTSETTDEMSTGTKVALVATGLVLGLGLFVGYEVKKGMDTLIDALPETKPKQ